MHIFNLIVIFILAYLLGSLATAVWVGKIFHNIDIREHGSGNAGATNVIRVLGWKTGMPVFLADMAKGWLAASLPLFFNLTEWSSSQLINLQIMTGLTAVAGHIFPVFAGFRGGKGVATTFGVVLALHPWLTLTCFGIFIVVLLISGYVSISSIIAGISFPLLLLLFFDSPSLMFSIFSILMAVALIVTHRKNISRLLKGQESKFIRKNGKNKKAG